MSSPEELILANLSLVGIIARSRIRRLGRKVDLGDLISLGFIGLVDAAHRFNPDRGYRFNTFASWRIHGAISDGLREPGKRRGRNIQLDQSIDVDCFPSAECFRPEAPLVESEVKVAVRKAIGLLTAREKSIIELYHFENIGMREIAKRYGVSASAISFAHKRALGKLRLRLRDFEHCL